MGTPSGANPHKARSASPCHGPLSPYPTAANRAAGGKNQEEICYVYRNQLIRLARLALLLFWNERHVELNLNFEHIFLVHLKGGMMMKKNLEDSLEYKFLVLRASGYILCYFMVFFFSLSLHKLIFTKSRDMNLAWNKITGCFFLHTNANVSYIIWCTCIYKYIYFLFRISFLFFSFSYEYILLTLQ